jgi:hypothetical protein
MQGLGPAFCIKKGEQDIPVPLVKRSCFLEDYLDVTL